MFDFHSVPSSAVETSSLTLLRGLVAAKLPPYIVEAGTFEGASAKAMSDAAPQAVIDTIDPCEQCWTERFIDYPNITPHLCRADEFTPREKIHFLFVDSDIDGRVEDLAHFRPWLHDDAVVVMDDAQLLSRVEGFQQVKIAGALILQVA